MRTLIAYLAGIATAWAALALYGRIPHADRARSQSYTLGGHRFTTTHRGNSIVTHITDEDTLRLLTGGNGQ